MPDAIDDRLRKVENGFAEYKGKAAGDIRAAYDASNNALAASSKNTKDLFELATNYATLSEGVNGMRGHIAELKEFKQWATRSLILMLIGMLGTTIGWIATAVMK